MRALTLQPGEDFRSLTMRDIPLPAQPAPGKIRLQVKAVGLNPVDYKISQHHPDTWLYPHALGIDIAGIVISGQSPFAAGTRVALHHDLRQPGGLAEFVDVDARAVAPIPAPLSFAAAAALPCAGLTAVQAIHYRLKVQPQDTILVVGGSGAVGAFAVQLAHRAGAQVIATASTQKAMWLRRLGADLVLDYTKGDIWSQVDQLGVRISGIVDTVGTDSVDQGLLRLAHGGGLVHINGGPSALPAGFQKAVSIHEVALGAAYSHGDARNVLQLGADLRVLMDLVAAGAIDPLYYRTTFLPGVAAAYQDLYEGKVLGKIVACL